MTELYELGKDILKNIPTVWDSVRSRQAHRAIGKAEAARSDPHLYRFIEWKYGKNNLLTRAEQTYPTMVFPALISLSRDFTRKEELFALSTKYRSLI